MADPAELKSIRPICPHGAPQVDTAETPSIHAASVRYNPRGTGQPGEWKRKAKRHYYRHQFICEIEFHWKVEAERNIPCRVSHRLQIWHSDKDFSKSIASAYDAKNCQRAAFR